MKILLDDGHANPEATTSGGVPAIFVALGVTGLGSSELEDILRELIDAQANLNQTYKGRSPLAWAAQNEPDDIIDFMLRHGADPNYGDVAPIAVAAAWKRCGVIDKLVRSNADVNAVAGKDRRTALSFLISAGKLTQNCQATFETLAGKTDLRLVDEYQFPPLLQSLYENRDELVPILLQHGADANGHGPNGTTPLCAAVVQGKPEIVDILLAHGARLDTRCDNITALELAEHPVDGIWFKLNPTGDYGAVAAHLRQAMSK